MIYAILGDYIENDSNQGSKRNIFRGGKVIFPGFFPSMKCFFLVENSHFGRPKTNFSSFEKWKEEEEEEKKRSSPHFLTFPPAILNFPPSLFGFFLLFCFIFHFFLASLFLIVQQKFPGQSLWGSTRPPAPNPPACYATDSNLFERFCVCFQIMISVFQWARPSFKTFFCDLI